MKTLRHTQFLGDTFPGTFVNVGAVIGPAVDPTHAGPKRGMKSYPSLFTLVLGVLFQPMAKATEPAATAPGFLELIQTRGFSQEPLGSEGRSSAYVLHVDDLRPSGSGKGS